ncbi:MAG: Rieske (2Fe-2S) protein [Candidatus Tectomicrobia bacterium]|nr:Rieske (2Fe-2S) protein [Candidatus Tectomicrobia bacterium]
MNETDQTTRRGWLAIVLMGTGLALSYGLFVAQGLMFLLPKRLKPRTRLLFAGQVDRYKIGSVRSFYDLQGNEILVKRSDPGFQAFSSVCPHLGCRVHWEGDKQQFFCPCHRGVFDVNGVAISGPPAAAGQSLSQIPLKVDELSGVVYIEVKEAKRKET